MHLLCQQPTCLLSILQRSSSDDSLELPEKIHHHPGGSPQQVEPGWIHRWTDTPVTAVLSAVSEPPGLSRSLPEDTCPICPCPSHGQHRPCVSSQSPADLHTGSPQPLLPLFQGGEPCVGEEAAQVRGAAQSSAHQTNPHILSVSPVYRPCTPTIDVCHMKRA